MSTHAAPSGPGVKKHSESTVRQLTPLLVWAVVFCDIGTSVYYVPGILYERVGNIAPFFVWIGLAGFVLLAAKYVEICWRNPDGGGVVSVANEAFSPMVGAIGGLLISIGYFLTSAISSVSGIHYLATIFPKLDNHVVAMASVILLGLAIINTIGIRESASLALVMAASALVVNVGVILVILWGLGSAEMKAVEATLSQARGMDRSTFLVGFSTAWLAFSGLESISQLSPAMQNPIARTARKGMRIVVGTMIVTSPVLTLLAVALLPDGLKQLSSERFISEIGGLYGGLPVRLAVVFTGSALLLLASNTAIIGCYHVFLSLAEKGFLPSAIAHRNRTFGTPQIAILVATLVPVAIVALSGGDMQVLAGLYAFGLLGAFVLSSAGLDLIRWRAKQHGWRFALGLFTTALVLVAWLVTLRIEGEATVYGILLVAVGLVVTVGTRRKWFVEWLYTIPLLAKLFPANVERAEGGLEVVEQAEILSLAQAESIADLYPSSTLIALRSPNPGLVHEALTREKGTGGRTIYALYVEERTGLFVRDWAWSPSAEGVQALQAAAKAAEAEGMTLIPIWTVSYNAVEGILRAAEATGVTAIMIGASQRNAIYHLLRGHVLAGLARRLPPGVRLLIYG
jgi:amino acid transporter/nucleotide-binding universal stress UspA family protein